MSATPPPHARRDRRARVSRRTAARRRAASTSPRALECQERVARLREAWLLDRGAVSGDVDEPARVVLGGAGRARRWQRARQSAARGRRAERRVPARSGGILRGTPSPRLRRASRPRCSSWCGHDLAASRPPPGRRQTATVEKTPRPRPSTLRRRAPRGDRPRASTTRRSRASPPRRRCEDVAVLVPPSALARRLRGDGAAQMPETPPGKWWKTAAHRPGPQAHAGPAGRSLEEIFARNRRAFVDLKADVERHQIDVEELVAKKDSDPKKVSAAVDALEQSRAQAAQVDDDDVPRAEGRPDAAAVAAVPRTPRRLAARAAGGTPPRRGREAR